MALVTLERGRVFMRLEEPIGVWDEEVLVSLPPSRTITKKLSAPVASQGWQTSTRRLLDQVDRPDGLAGPPKVASKAPFPSTGSRRVSTRVRINHLPESG